MYKTKQTITIIRNYGHERVRKQHRCLECGCCSNSKSILLVYFAGENLHFCSEMYIAEFRKEVEKGACKQCGNVVRSFIAPNKEYCSLLCMNKAILRNGKISNGSSIESDEKYRYSINICSYRDRWCEIPRNLRSINRICRVRFNKERFMSSTGMII